MSYMYEWGMSYEKQERWSQGNDGGGYPGGSLIRCHTIWESSCFVLCMQAEYVDPQHVYVYK